MRHTRDMIRHHRERVIANRIELCKRLFNNWVPEHGLSKWSEHHHKCDWCNPPYHRTQYHWRQDPELQQ